jgi:hypothetical protein
VGIKGGALMELVEIDNKKPLVHENCYIDPRAILIGEVIVEEGVGIWPGVVVRADDAMVVIKRGAMILENAVIEAAKGRSMVIGAKASSVTAPLFTGPISAIIPSSGSVPSCWTMRWSGRIPS